MQAITRTIQASLIAGVLGAGLLAQEPQKLPPPNAPTHNPGFSEHVPNKVQSGNTPKTNSTLQEDRNGVGTHYLGWLGLLGLAGLFGLSRGTNPAPKSPRG